MKKEDKQIIKDSIAELLKEYSAVYLVQTNGLNAELTSALRREAFKAEVKLVVVKNTLVKKAMEESDVDFNIDRPLTEDEINETIKYCKHEIQFLKILILLKFG